VLQQLRQLLHQLLLVLIGFQHTSRQHGCIPLLQDSAGALLCWRC
jgi:hypothetical protein